jgi:hypothetical protein
MGIGLFAVVGASWYFWALVDLAFYADGLFNLGCVSVPFLLLPIPVAVVYLSMLIAGRVARRSGWDGRKWRRRGLTAIALLAFVVSLVPAYACGVGPGDMWARGLARYVRAQGDVEGIQNWLSTLDPNDCRDQPLEVKIAPGVKISNPPKYIPIPPSVGGLARYNNRLLRDDTGRPMIRFYLGGGGFITHWGIVIGHKDMPTPPSDRSDPGENRFPLAPGVYIWQEVH